MMGAALLAVISLGSVGGAHLMSKARWTWRTPRIGIALWQALGLCWGLSTIGALLADWGAPPAVLLAWATVPLPGRWTIPGMDLGVAGAWLAMVLDVTLRAVLILLRFVRGAWRHVRI